MTGVSKRILPLALIVCAFALAPLGAQATAPGQAGPIVYVNAAGHVAVASASGSTRQDSGQTGTSPSWAPASTAIAYVSGGRVWTITYDGSSFGTPTAVPNTTGAQFVAWSPNGLRLAFTDGTNIFTLRTDGSDKTNLTNSSATVHNVDPAWSPDGSEIAFATDRDSTTGTFDIYTMSSSDGRNQTKLTSSAKDDTGPSWSPDGDTIAFTSNRDGNDQVYRVASLGGSEVRLTNDASSDSDPSWSPTGSQLAIVADGNLALLSSSGGSVSPFAPATPGTQPDWGLPFGPLSPATITPSGGITVGTTVTADDGTFSATPKTVTYQWLRCNSAGASCAAISGATSKTYTVTTSDNGSTLRVTVTATSDSGQTASSTSFATSLIQQAVSVPGQAPTIVDVPIVTVAPPSGITPIEGAVVVGSTAIGSIGTWRGQFPMTFTYQWKKCDDKHNCYTIDGATGASFVTTTDLYGWAVAVEVTATNALGSTRALSAQTRPLTAIEPRGLMTPPIVGQNVVGETLSVTNGTWFATLPLTYAYEWRRCNPQGTLDSCAPIPGATSTSYVLTEADRGWTIRAYITATNVAGSDTAITNHTFPILPKPRFAPTASVAPQLFGNPLPGLRLQATPGTWSGDQPIELTIAWQRCDATGAGCVDLSGQTTWAYGVTKKDAGSRIRFAVTATNEIGTVTTFSQPTDAVRLVPHRPGRTIRGTAKADYLAGSGFDDKIYGLGGSDTLLGGAGDDLLDGGAGNDVIDGGSGRDRILAGAGSDTVLANDGDRDTIDCGAGNDRAVVDGIDVVVNCEAVQVTGQTTPAPRPTTTVPTTTRTTTVTTTTTTTASTTTRPAPSTTTLPATTTVR